MSVCRTLSQVKTTLLYRLLMYKVTEINGVKTYNMSAGKSYSEFMETAAKHSKSLRYDNDFKRRIELIQDFQFNVATTQVEVSPDQRFIVAAGIYGPQVKIYDTAELSLKCLRGLDCEVVKFKILSEDYSKIVMAQTDRSIDFHAQYGAHYKTRIPHYPRDLEYNPSNANLCVSASSEEVYRISLEEGRFLTPYHTNSAINSLHHDQPLNVLFCGGEGIEAWDCRQRNRVCTLKTSAPVTSLRSDPSGLLLAAGEGSNLSLYDVRFDRKVLSVRCSYNQPINSIRFMEDSQKHILFSNSRQIKIVDGDGKLFTSVQPDNSISMFTTIGSSGLILAALDEAKVGCYFIPQLGPGPSWAPYVDNITQELEEEHSKVVYDEFKFVSREEVRQLGCENLIGTKMLREHMHGFLMHLRLYAKMKDRLQAVDLTQRKKKRAEEVVNKEMPERIETKKVVSDPRFDMGNNPDFAIDQTSEGFIQRHPHMRKQLQEQAREKQKQMERQLRVNKKKGRKIRKQGRK